jgi:hypothetical protein
MHVVKKEPQENQATRHTQNPRKQVFHYFYLLRHSSCNSITNSKAPYISPR